MNLKNRQWSRRSQSSLLEELRLKRELANCLSLAADCEAESLSAKEERDRHLQRAVAGRGGLGGRGLAENLRQIEDHARVAVAYREHAKALQAQIEALSPPPDSAQAVERAERQGLLASLAAGREEEDRKIGDAVKDLRALLEARRKATAHLAQVARVIGLELFDLDDERFETLLASLPCNVASASESWMAWLVGDKREGTRAYRVCRDDFTLPETLVSGNVFQRGDIISLTPQEAADLIAGKALQGQVYVGHTAFPNTTHSSPPIVPVEPGPAAEAAGRKPDEVGLRRLEGEPSRGLTAQQLADFVRR